ncbi:MAG: hypothetical protein ISQ06_04205 [Planctomycetaceae bacterium]|nr:hypothetical protein [Planctomycetaceae bacterium]
MTLLRHFNSQASAAGLPLWAFRTGQVNDVTNPSRADDADHGKYATCKIRESIVLAIGYCREANRVEKGAKAKVSDVA